MSNQTSSERLSAVMVAAVLAVIRIATAEEQPADVWANAAKYEFGTSRANIYAIEEEIRSASSVKYNQYEDKLIGLLKNSSSTYEAKDFACRMLRIVGSEKCVPVVAEILADDKMGHMARYAIQGLPYTSVDTALRSALKKAEGTARIGIISSIASRADNDAVAILKPFVTNSDATLASAAISALGQIGTADALKVLTSSKVAESLQAVAVESRLKCADRMLANGMHSKAAAVYDDLIKGDIPKGVRVAAVTGLARADKNKALPKVIEMLKSKDASLRRAAGKALMELKGEKAAKAVLAEMGALFPDAQVIAINLLSVSGVKNAGPEIGKMIGSNDDEVKIAAIQALSELGDASNVELLASLVKTGGDTGKAAVQSLARLKGDGVSEAVMKTLPGVDASSKSILIGGLAGRQGAGIVGELIKYADDQDESVRVETMKALGALVKEKEIPLLAGLMLKASPGRVQTTAEQAVQNACMKIEGDSKRIAPLVSAMEGAKAEDRAIILRCLGKIGGQKALEIIRTNIKDTDEKVQEAAIRALIGWADAAAVPDLLDLAKKAVKENIKILAFRSYVRLVSLPSNLEKNPAVTARTLSEAMNVASRPDEKKLVLGALSGIADLSALEAVQNFIQDDSLMSEAELASITIAGRLQGKARDKSLALIKKISETSKNERNRKLATEMLKK